MTDLMAMAQEMDTGAGVASRPSPIHLPLKDHEARELRPSCQS